MAAEYELREYAVSVDIPKFPAIVSYRRSWRERLFSRPWRPLRRIGSRLSLVTLMERRIANAEELMGRSMLGSVYGNG